MNITKRITKASIILTLGFAAAAFAYEARVVGVSDGDTITVLDVQKEQHKIRLAGIDAPEKGQEFGNKAKEHLSDLVYGKTVNLPDAKIDKYGRTVSRVLVGNTDAGLAMIQAGMSGDLVNVQALPDRAAAIMAAVRHADINDIVLVAGKGHESTQEINGKKFDFSDQEHIRLAAGGSV